MTFQSTVRRFLGYGVVGEFVFDGPRKVQTLPLGSTNPLNNVFGRAFRNLAVSGGPASADIVAAGSVWAGVLVNPKEHALQGQVAGTLAPSLVLPNGDIAGFASMGFVLLQCDALQAAAPQIGDILQYQITTGIIVTVAPGTAPAAGYANVPGGTVYHLPQATNAAGQPFVAELNA